MSAIYDGLMYLTGWPLAVILIVGGLYFTVRTGFPQLNMLRESFRVIFEKPQVSGRMSSFSALMISTASRVGPGNIIGVSTALCIGGAGSVFWMWLTALIGGASAFVESTLAQIYKRKNPDGSSYGGPAFYIETACRSKFLAVIFAIALVAAYGIGDNMLTSYNLQSSFQHFAFYQENSRWITWFFGAVIAACFLLTILGGRTRIAKANCIIVPVMGIFYILITAIALYINFRNIPGMFMEIFRSAFDFKAIFGGFTGSALIMGMKRGLYSNEAGVGSAPNAAAVAEVSHPVKQGLVQMFSVFIDTHLICTATALMCLSSGVVPTKELTGAPLVLQSLQETFGILGLLFIVLAMVLFSFTTLLGNFYYVENNFACIFGRQPGKVSLLLIRIAGAVLIFFGASMKLDVAWNITDIMLCILAFINIPVCIIIGGTASQALKHYREQLKSGMDPVFRAEDIGLRQSTDFWHG